VKGGGPKQKEKRSILRETRGENDIRNHKEKFKRLRRAPASGGGRGLRWKR